MFHRDKAYARCATENTVLVYIFCEVKLRIGQQFADCHEHENLML